MSEALLRMCLDQEMRNIERAEGKGPKKSEAWKFACLSPGRQRMEVKLSVPHEAHGAHLCMVLPLQPLGICGATFHLPPAWTKRQVLWEFSLLPGYLPRLFILDAPDYWVSTRPTLHTRPHEPGSQAR